MEPIDAAGVILKGLAGSGKGGEAQAAPAGSNWLQQKQSMIHWFNLFGRKKK